MKIRLCKTLRLALTALTMFTASSARADLPLWELGIGAAALSVPHYPGAEQSRNWLLPVPYFVYRGSFLQADREGTRAVLIKQPGLNLDLSANVSAPVRSADNRARTGMPDLPTTLELGPNLSVVLAQGANWKLDLRVPVRAGFTLSRQPTSLGYEVSPSLNLQGQLGAWGLGLRSGPSWGDGKRHQFFYGVDAAQASANRPAYRAESGYAGWKSTMAVSQRQGPWWTAMYLSSDTVANASFENSPLVKKNLNWSAGVVVVWVFASSAERVADKR